MSEDTVSAHRICEYCGKKLSLEQKYCVFCGLRQHQNGVFRTTEYPTKTEKQFSIRQQTMFYIYLCSLIIFIIVVIIISLSVIPIFIFSLSNIEEFLLPEYLFSVGIMLQGIPLMFFIFITFLTIICSICMIFIQDWLQLKKDSQNLLTISRKEFLLSIYGGQPSLNVSTIYHMFVIVFFFTLFSNTFIFFSLNFN
ncbi:MAG: hypothetical protein ACFFBD_26795, partial [Candidatus Hodarchaeota archaeon]